MNARQLLEAESPKRIFQQMQSQSIWPGRDYYLNLVPTEQSWEEGEFCPVMIQARNEMTQLDGLYGLTDEVMAALRAADPAFQLTNDTYDEDKLQSAMSAYVEPIWAGVKLSITSGQVNGVAGPRNWRIVYFAKHGRAWQPERGVAVVAGKQYGEPMIQEAETPKSIFRQILHKTKSGGKPVLMVRTRQTGSFTAPLIIDSHGLYGWLATGLPPALRELMREQGEIIWYAMNEGNDFQGQFDIEDPDNEDPNAPPLEVVAWSVMGKPDRAPEHLQDWSYQGT